MSITFDIEKNAIEAICRGLEEAHKEAPNALKRSINATAKSARKLLVERAQKAYTVKVGRFNKSTSIKNATFRNLTAAITAKGSPMELKEFKVSPSKVPENFNPNGKTRAKVYKVSTMKTLEVRGIKAFVAQFKSGHISVAQRRTKARLPIKVLYSTSIPKMIGNENEVFKFVKPDIERIFNEHVNIQMKRILSKVRKL